MADLDLNIGQPVQPPLAGPEAVHQLGEPHEGPPRRRRHKVSLRVSALNITAFMDLTFNLLLFFVLTASFSLGEGVLPADLPSGGGGRGGVGTAVGPAPPQNPVTINLRSIGMDKTLIQVEGFPTAPTNFDDLFEKLRSTQYTAVNPNGLYKADNPIIIKPDRNVPWNAVVDAFNAVVRAKYTNVGFAPSGG